MSILSKRLSKALESVIVCYINECGSLYNFDGSEAINRLGLCGSKDVNLSVSSVGMKLSWPIPFNKECINEYDCEGLKYNNGLFTQCKNKKEGDRYCKTCEEECSKNASGLPDNGCISDRMKCGLMEFRDPKGRKPSAFLSILKKKNISIEKVREDAKVMSIMIDEEHFTETVKEKVVKEKKEKGEKRGRPKKAPKEVETSGVVDLFAELVEEAVVNKTESEVVTSEVVVEEKPKKEKVSAEEKELKKAEKETAKAAKKEAEKQAREEKRAAEKAAKAEAKKEKKPAKKDVKKDEKKAEEQVAKIEEPKAKVTVTRFEHEGKKYLKSTENILYDPVTKDELGIWCEESKTIKALPEDDDEEIEEEEYESDDE